MSNPQLIWPFVRQFEMMLYPVPKNRLHQVGNRMYCGEFTNVPSRSGSAEVTLVLGGSMEPDAYACFVYAHHEGTDMELYSKEGLLKYLEEWLVQNQLTDAQYPSSPSDGDWHTGLALLLEEVKRIYNEQ